MKKLAKISALLFAVVLIVTGCKKLPEFTDGKTTTVSPTVAINVYTQRVTGIGDTKAYFEGFIDNTEISGLTVTVGFCWNTTGNPTLNDNNITTELNENFHFSCTAYGLVQNTTYYVKAWAIIGTENPDSAIYGNEESFTTQGSGGGSGDAPTGAINGLFSVSDTKQVYFSQGNLQYQASTNTWRFAENQYDYIGEANSNISSSYNGWIDLFGWGTGDNPINTSTDNYDYNIFYDWGNNAISNGGDTSNIWHTLTLDQWLYIIETRNTISSILFAKAKVNYINGIILFPDNWNSDTYSINNPNSKESSYTSNIINSSNWIDIFESNGAVFIPAAGHRDLLHFDFSNGIRDCGWGCRYWSSTNTDTENAYYLSSDDNYLSMYNESRSYGRSVRLVQDAN